MSAPQRTSKIGCSVTGVLILIAATWLTACIQTDHHPFPARWGAVHAGADDICPNVAGSFNVLGESDTGRYPIPLAHVFLNVAEQKNWPPAKFSKTSYVAIEQATDAMTVALWTDGSLITRKELKKDDQNGYRCRSDGVSLRGEFPTVHGLVGYVGLTYTLFKSDDWLIVKAENAGGGLALLIPAYASQTIWYRYRTLQK